MTPSVTSKVVSSIPFKRGSSSDGGLDGLTAAKRRKEATVGGLVVADEETRNPEPMSTSEPHPHDVLCGRGHTVNSHPGNVIFRRLIQANKEVYHSCKDYHKALLSRSIVDVIRNQTPPGRFLIRHSCGNEWVDVGDEKALQKTHVALRSKERSGSIHLKYETVDDKVARQAVAGLANRQEAANAPASFLSSKKITNVETDSIAPAIVPAESDGSTDLSEADAATMEDSELKFDSAPDVRAEVKRNKSVSTATTNLKKDVGFDLDDLGDPLFVFHV